MIVGSNPTIDTRAQYYKTFYGRNLRIFVLSSSLLHSSLLHSSLLQKSVNYGCKKFYSTGPRREKITKYIISLSLTFTRKKGIQPILGQGLI
jgi:hypothetical protein